MSPKKAAFSMSPVGDHANGNTPNRSTPAEVVIQHSCGGPHLVILQNVRINEHAQPSAETIQKHTTVGL
jgi:hypothetical protein